MTTDQPARAYSTSAWNLSMRRTALADDGSLLRIFRYLRNFARIISRISRSGKTTSCPYRRQNRGGRYKCDYADEYPQDNLNSCEYSPTKKSEDERTNDNAGHACIKEPFEYRAPHSLVLSLCRAVLRSW